MTVALVQHSVIPIKGDIDDEKEIPDKQDGTWPDMAGVMMVGVDTVHVFIMSATGTPVGTSDNIDGWLAMFRR